LLMVSEGVKRPVEDITGIAAWPLCDMDFPAN
jgi:hypothetical protein